MLSSRTLAAAFWANFFALYWLIILDVVPPYAKTSMALLFFFVGAVVVSIVSAAPEKEDKSGSKLQPVPTQEPS